MKTPPIHQAVLCLLAGLLMQAGLTQAEESHAPAGPHVGVEKAAIPEPSTTPVDDGTPRLGVIQGIALPFKPLKPPPMPVVPSAKEEPVASPAIEKEGSKQGTAARGAAKAVEIDAHAAGVPQMRPAVPATPLAAAHATEAEVQTAKSKPAQSEAAVGSPAAASSREPVRPASTTSTKADEAAHALPAPTVIPAASTFRPIFAAGRHRSSMYSTIAPAPGSQVLEASPAAAGAVEATEPVTAKARSSGRSDAATPAAAQTTAIDDQPLERLRQRLAQTFGSRDLGAATVRVTSKGSAAPASAGSGDDMRPASTSKGRSIDRRAAAEATSRLALAEPTGGSRSPAVGASHPSLASDAQTVVKQPTAAELTARFNPRSGACGSGQRQSPIDLQNTFKVDLEPVSFHYQPTPFAVIDNGRTVLAQVAAGNSIEVNGRKYELTRVEFRHPAEERIDGKTYALGVHLVHRDSEGRQAVVAVVMDGGGSEPAADPVVQTVWNNLPLERGEAEQARVPLDLERLLPATRGYFTYMGSMTAPPCDEGVLWMVMKTPMSIATAQVELFARLYPMNARGLQAVNGRMVKESN